VILVGMGHGQQVDAVWGIVLTEEVAQLIGDGWVIRCPDLITGVCAVDQDRDVSEPTQDRVPVLLGPDIEEVHPGRQARRVGSQVRAHRHSHLRDRGPDGLIGLEFVEAYPRLAVVPGEHQPVGCNYPDTALSSENAIRAQIVPTRVGRGSPLRKMACAQELVDLLPQLDVDVREGFNNLDHAAQRYSWIRPPSTSLRSTGVRVVLRTCGARLPAGTTKPSPRCGLSCT